MTTRHAHRRIHKRPARWLAWSAMWIAGCIQSAEPPATVKEFPAPEGVGVYAKVGSPTEMESTIALLKPLHKPLGEPMPGDWLDQHREPGQSFRQYLRARPATPIGRRSVIHVQPLGDFTPEQRQIVELSAEYLALYFGRPVELLDTLPLSIIPDRARRVHPQWQVKQILSTYVLDEVLRPRLPSDAAAYIAFTASDLWPGEGWNFVFGQASLENRVGVWSITRNGNPAEGEEGFRLCLRRTLKTATHETGHMFSLRHCTAYECNMCGSNHRQESDRHPLYLCPECHAKVCWATNDDPAARARRLARFCARHGLAPERNYFEEAGNRLSRQAGR